MKTQVFTHKGVIGIMSSEDAEGLIAKPVNGNLGCVCDASMVEIQKEALDLLKNIPKGAGGLGVIEVYGADGIVLFGWLGGYMQAFKLIDIETSRDYDPSLLTATEGVVPTQDFIDYVEAFA